jgi:hypothetical protein
MSLYNVQNTATSLSMQPYLHYKRKWYNLLIAVVLFLIVPQFFKWQLHIDYACYIVAALLFIWALYDFFIKAHTTILFDKNKKVVIKIIPKIVKKQLIAFNQIESITPITVNGMLHYCITNNTNMFGKNYPITDFFIGESEECREFEEDILPLLFLTIDKK